MRAQSVPRGEPDLDASRCEKKRLAASRAGQNDDIYCLDDINVLSLKRSNRFHHQTRFMAGSTSQTCCTASC